MRANLCDNDLISIGVDHKVRIVGDHDDLPFGFGRDEQRDEFIEDGLRIEIFLWLVDDKWPVVCVVQSEVQ